MRPEDLRAARLELEWKTFGAEIAMDMGLMSQPEFTIQQNAYDFIGDQVRLAIRTRILSDYLPPERVTESTTVRVEEPASTWQMWKRNNQGKWYTWWWLAKWLEKWPVIMTGHDKRVTMSVNLERFRAYPEAEYRPSDFSLGSRVVLSHVVSPVQWLYDTDPTVQNRDGS